MRARLRHQGVSGLVVGNDLLLPGTDDPRLPLEARHDPVDRLVEVRHVDRVLVLAGGAERGFVHEIGEIGADEPNRPRGDGG